MIHYDDKNNLIFDKEDKEKCNQRLMNSFVGLSWVAEHWDISIVDEWLLREAIDTATYCIKSFKEEIERRNGQTTNG